MKIVWLQTGRIVICTFLMQKVRQSCKRMAAKHNCMAAPDEAFAHGEQVTGASSGRGTTSTRRAPYHYGGGTARTPSRCTSRTIAASRSCGALSRGKAIQSLLVHRYNSIFNASTQNQRCSTSLGSIPQYRDLYFPRGSSNG